MFNEETRRKSTGLDNAQALVTENKGRSKRRGLNSGLTSPKVNHKLEIHPQVNHKLELHLVRERNATTMAKKETLKSFARHSSGNKRGNNNRNKDDATNTTTTLDEEVTVVSNEDEGCLKVVDDCLNLVDDQNEWVIVTSSSYHATFGKEMFTTYKPGDYCMVKMGNSSYLEIVRIRTVYVQNDAGCTMMPKDVCHVHDPRLILIFESALDHAGYEKYFGHGRWKLIRGSLVIFRGRACNILYETNMRMCRGA